MHPAGGLAQAITFPVNTYQFGNAVALFLGVEPADIFLYVFLPPLLFEAAVRIDYFVFKKARRPGCSVVGGALPQHDMCAALFSPAALVRRACLAALMEVLVPIAAYADAMSAC